MSSDTARSTSSMLPPDPSQQHDVISPVHVSATHTFGSTPCCVVRYSQAKKNAETMLARAKMMGLDFRPHVKTHKTIEGALLQTGGERKRLIVSTVAELTFFVDEGGFDDVIYGVPLGCPNRFPLLADYIVRQKKDVKIVFDHPQQLRVFEDWCESDPIVPEKFPDLFKGDTKFRAMLMLGCSATEAAEVGKRLGREVHQVGLDPEAQTTFAFAKQVAASKFCVYSGVYIHAAWGYDARGESECKEAALAERAVVANFAKKLAQEWKILSFAVTVGSTPTASVTVEDPDELKGVVTELHAGNYLVYDTMQREIGAILSLNDCAMYLRCQVISHYEQRNTLLIDLGWTGASAQGSEKGYGAVLNYPELLIKSLKQETGEVGPKEEGAQLDFARYPIGTILKIAPYHACAGAHQYREIFVENDHGELVDVWRRAPAR